MSIVKLRADLGLQIEEAVSGPNSVLIIQPADGMSRFPRALALWLQEELERYGVKAIILPDRVVKIAKVETEYLNEDYRRGWIEAVNQIKEAFHGN